MQITEIVLKNVKSYADATIRFPTGTIAISGPNGAGKSTLLEAIGFALFDSLPYRNQREFMRHNALESDVRVSFLSRLDECEYQVVRTLKRSAGSSDTVTSRYYVYGFASQSSVAEQKQGVQDFLRAHICLADHDDLARIFDNVLGVPQGRLTADFMLAPTQRKGTFDPLLGVDAYRNVFDRLRDVLDVQQGTIADQERQVAALEPEAARLPALEAALAASVQEHAEASALSRSLATSLERLREEQKGLEAQRATLDQQRELVRQRTHLQEDLKKRLQAEEAEVAKALRAAELVQASAKGYKSFREAEQAFAALEEQRATAESLRQTRNAIEKNLVALQTRRAALEQEVAEAEVAREKRAALAPQVAAQDRLESDAQEFGQSLGKARHAARQLADALQHFASAGLDEPLPYFKGPFLAEAQEDAAFAESQLTAQYESAQEIGLWLKQRTELRARIRQSREMRDEVAIQVKQCRAAEAAASGLNGLIQQLQTVQEQISAFQAQRRFNEQSQRMARDGLCPFFQEQCPKVDEGQSLTPIISTLIRDFAHHATAVEVESDRLEVEVGLAREAQRQVDRLADLEPQLQRLEEELSKSSRAEQSLTQRITENLEGIWSSQEISGTIARLEKRGESLARALQDLGNPRQLAERLHGPAAAYEERKNALEEVAEKQESNKSELARSDESLRPFADLENRLATARQSMTANREDHETYLSQQETAADLPRRQKAAAALQDEVANNAIAVSESQELLAACAANWNPADLVTVQTGISKTQGELGAANERTRSLEAQIAQSRQEIAKLEEAVANLRDVRQLLAESQHVKAVTEFLRNVIRDAGPQITRHLIQQISAESNTLFSEIMGDASAELSLTEDYNILLEQHGHRRGFAQLSGGEQMSAALAVRLGLLRHVSDINIAFFDEPTQNMDSERRHNLAEQLERVTGFHQLFVISHDDTFEPMVSTVLRVSKENGVSTVEQV